MVRITKISVGILLLILSIILMVRSGFENFIAALVGTGDIGGAAGILMAITYIIAAAIYILTNRTYSVVPDIVSFIILILGGLMGLFNANIPGTHFLIIWAWVGIAIGAIVLIVSIADLVLHPVSDDEDEEPDQNEPYDYNGQNQQMNQYPNQFNQYPNNYQQYPNQYQQPNQTPNMNQQYSGQNNNYGYNQPVQNNPYPNNMNQNNMNPNSNFGANNNQFNQGRQPQNQFPNNYQSNSRPMNRMNQNQANQPNSVNNSYQSRQNQFPNNQFNNQPNKNLNNGSYNQPLSQGQQPQNQPNNQSQGSNNNNPYALNNFDPSKRRSKR